MGQRLSDSKGKEGSINCKNNSNASESDASSSFSSPETETRKSRSFIEYKLQQRLNHFPFDFEHYYPLISSFTFPSHLIKISPALAQAFIDYYQTRFNQRSRLTIASVQMIRNFLSDLVNLFSQHSEWSKNGVFIRLSSRSPKDGDCISKEELWKMFHSKYEKLIELQQRKSNSGTSALMKSSKEEQKIIESNTKLIAFCYAQFHSLRVRNSSEVLIPVLSSERIFIDLNEALDCHNEFGDDQKNINTVVLATPSLPWSIHLILREWCCSLDPSLEFRCFISNSQLTAISQNNHLCKFELLQNENIVKQIKLIISRYWLKNIAPILSQYPSYTNYVIDVGILVGDADSSSETFTQIINTCCSTGYLPSDAHCVVIELNPLLTSTGAALFHWEFDKQILRRNEQSKSIKDELKEDDWVDDVVIRVRTDFINGIVEYVEEIILHPELSQAGNEKKETNTVEYIEFLEKIEKQHRNIIG